MFLYRDQLFTPGVLFGGVQRNKNSKTRIEKKKQDHC